MGKVRRRFWSDDEKRRIVGQARLVGVSVSQVARRYDVNANLVFKWLRDPRFQTEAEPAPFLPVEVVSDTAPVDDQPPPEASRIMIELAGGHRLTVCGGFDPDCIVRLVRGLTA
jgi:transposase